MNFGYQTIEFTIYENNDMFDTCYFQINLIKKTVLQLLVKIILKTHI